MFHRHTSGYLPYVGTRCLMLNRVLFRVLNLSVHILVSLFALGGCSSYGVLTVYDARCLTPIQG
jgi:hypothetical protein